MDGLGHVRASFLILAMHVALPLAKARTGRMFDEPALLLHPLLKPRKPKLFVHFVIQGNLLESLRKLRPVLILHGHRRRRTRCSTSSPSERTSVSSTKTTLTSPRGGETKSPTSATRHGALGDGCKDGERDATGANAFDASVSRHCVRLSTTSK